MTDKEVRQRLRTVAPATGTRWTHYKGSTYTIVESAIVEATGELLVIYKSDLYGFVWARPLNIWNEKVALEDGLLVPRFSPIG